MSKAPYETTGENALMIQASEGNAAEVTKILAQRKDIDINSVNKKGETALSLAVKSGSYNVVGKLLVAGADPNLKNNSGQSPLFIASLNNYENITRMLLENGADVNDADQRGWTPLMTATYNSHVPIVSLLLSYNADTSIQDCFGKRAIHRAKQEAVIKLLKKSEGTKGLSPIKKDFGSETTSSKKGNNLIVSPKSTNYKSYSDFSASKQFNRSQEIKKTTSSTSSFTNQSASRLSLHSETKISALNKSGSTPTKSFKSQLKPSNQKSGVSPNQSLTTSSIQHLISKDGISPEDKRVHFKEELAKIITHQISYYTQKMQTLLLQRVNYEIPTTVQESQHSIRSELEQILNFRIASIVSSLSTHFNVKLKFCLNNAGYDTNSMQVKPFLEDERLEIEPISIQPNAKLVHRYEEGVGNLGKLRKEITRMEGEIKHKGVPLPMSDPQTQPRDENDHAFGSFGNKWEIHTQLEEYLNQELNANTQFVIESSTDKVNAVARDERNALNKKLKEELELALEFIEERIRTKLEQVIDDKVNHISESLGQGKRYRSSSPAPQDPNGSYNVSSVGNYSPKKQEESQILSMTQSQRNFRDSPKRLSPTKARLMADLDEFRTREADLKSSNTFHGNFEPRPSYQVEQSNTERFTSGSRDRIRNLKEDLNANFESSPDETPAQTFNRTAPVFANSLQNETTFRSPAQRNSNPSLDTSSKDFHLSAASTDYAMVKKSSDYAGVTKDEFAEPKAKSEPVKEIPPTAKNDDTPSKLLLSEADRQAIEERKIFYRNQLKAKQQSQAQKAI